MKSARVLTALGTVGLLALLGPGAGARAASPPQAMQSPVFTLSIGYNGAPPDDDTIRPLHFADDDAAAFHEFARAVSQHSYLLTVLDGESQRRFPRSAREARAPSLADLRRTVADIRAEADRTPAAPPTVIIFYSGHGSGGGADRAALNLIDGLLTREVLYDEVLAPLRAGFVHLFIDACHAEAVVRPRDRQAELVTPGARDQAAYLRLETLARFPHVGAVVSSTAGTQAHEWDGYGSGIFTHELLSALRGAADVDGNQRIEYSEVAAFITAANRAIADPRLRPQIVFRPPSLNPRVPLVDLSRMRDVAFLRGRPAKLGAFWLEDERGNRLLDMRAEGGATVALAVPAGEVLYLRSDRGESLLQPRAGEAMQFESFSMMQSSLRARGTLDAALRRGLFAATYGPAYYRGFVDRADELVPVDLPETAGAIASVGATSLLDPEPPPPPRSRRSAKIALGTAVVLGAAAGALGVVAWKAHRDFDRTVQEVPATDYADRYRLTATLSVTSLVACVLAGAAGSYLLFRDSPTTW